MTASAVGYEHVQEWVKTRLGRTQATVVQTVAWAVLCLLLAQRVTPAALARAMPAEQAGRARARLTRVRRWWTGPPLDQTMVSPQLIHAALALLPPGQSAVVALDTTRLGPWEVWRAGIVVAGRTLPIGWAVIPYPWPKGRFRTTTFALIRRLQTAFPPGVHWTLVADRGFPSARLFAQLCQDGAGFSVAAALARLGDGSGRLCDGGGAFGSRTAGRRAADRRRHGPWAAGAAPGAGLGRRERGRGGSAPTQAKPRDNPRAGQAGQGPCPAPRPQTGPQDEAAEGEVGAS